MILFHLYRTPALSSYQTADLLTMAKQKVTHAMTGIETEFCFNIAATESLSGEETRLLRWLLAETFEPEKFSDKSFLSHHLSRVTHDTIVEVGPRMNFTTAWSTNAVSVCHACGLSKITRIERSRRYRLDLANNASITKQEEAAFTSLVHDRMTECPYPKPLKTFETGIKPEPVRMVPLIEQGRVALEKINREMGLGLDDWDLDYYTNLFVKDIKRNPTNVECFDLSQSNSEHSRHWFFRGKLILDGKEIPGNLMKIVKATYDANPNNSIIAFSDNSSAITGYDITTIIPETIGKPSAFRAAQRKYHVIFTAETHNFPSGVAPFPGAETGTGGRIRDVQATGTGGLVAAGTAAYCVGNLRIPGYELPWEDASYSYPVNLASPLQIEVEASNGASDYGNKFGEPVIQGFTRSFGLRLPDGERREWLKPIMFSAGVGQMDSRHTKKTEAVKDMLVVKIGGPAYRIGMGGGAASSMIQGENIAELDFNAVQRGDAEMEQKMNRVIRACVELGERNPIQSIHDQGAGGNCNVVKEIVHPAGAKIDIRKIQVGDKTLSVLEIWGAEYQEQNALLLKPVLKHMAARDKKVAMSHEEAKEYADRVAHLLRSNTKRGARKNIHDHYDLGNEFYERWLDAGLTYSAGMFSSANQTLEEAQEAKIDRVLTLLEPNIGDRVLEIGCGWGGFAERLLQKYECSVTGVTLSAEQLAYAKHRLQADISTARCDLRLQDYRDVHGTFDRVVSIEMLEAVGEAYWSTYFEKLRDRLRPSGIAVLQVITIHEDRFENYRRRPDFIQRYIFPGGMLPTKQIIERKAGEAGLQLVAEEFFGGGYARTTAAPTPR